MFVKEVLVYFPKALFLFLNKGMTKILLEISFETEFLSEILSMVLFDSIDSLSKSRNPQHSKQNTK